MGEGEADTSTNRPEKLEDKKEAIVVQPEATSHQGVEEEKSIEEQEDLSESCSENDENAEVLDGVKEEEVSLQDEAKSSQIDEDDGNEEVSLDDEATEVDKDSIELDDLEKAIDQHRIGITPEEDTYRKTPTMLDTTTAITNMLSEIVMESDSR